jgi:16S rRNA (guanine527-N7)-methyltransferase
VAENVHSQAAHDSFDNDTLGAALARHAIELTDEQISLLDRYAHVLWDWNEKLNLTRHTTYEKFVTRDIVDAQWIEQFLDSAERILDVGTGGGATGVILAILRPDLEVAVCDSVAKKARAVEDIVRRLRLPIRVYHARAEELLMNHEYDTLVIRAVAPLDKLLTWFKPRFSAFRRMLVVKGPAWVDEQSAARASGLLRGLELNTLASYPLPGTQSQSVIVEIKERH